MAINLLRRDASPPACGFGENQLMGEPHNIIRPPDMPPAAFADMWFTLQQDDIWTGMVKNRRHNGDHYWVRANVTPSDITSN